MGILRELLTKIGFKTDDRAFKRASTQIGTLKKRLGGLADRASVVTEKLDGMATAVVGAGVLGGASFIGGLIQTNLQFEKLEGNLETATGSAEKAAVQMDKLKAFAATTPFDLEQSVQAFTKLTNLGLDPSERALRSFGNTSAAMGKELSDFIEAVADASTGEFERLKEFGIKSSKQGDKVVFTFKGQKTEIKNTAADIQGFLVGLGEQDFAGAMDKQMQGLAGSFANVKQNALEFAIGVGKGGLNDAVKLTINSFNEMLTVTPELTNELGAKLGRAVIFVGKAFEFLVQNADKAAIAVGAVVAQFAVRKALSFVTTLGGIAKALALVAVQGVKAGLAMAVALGPIGLIVVAIGAAIAAVVAFSDQIGAWIEKNKEAGGVLGAIAGVLSILVDDIFPIFQEAIADLSDALLPALEGVVELLGSVFGAIMAIVKPLVVVFGTIIKIVFRVVGVVVKALSLVLKPIIKVVGFVAKIVGGVLGKIFKALAKIFDFIMDIAEPIIGVLETVFAVFEATIGIAIDILMAFFEFIEDVWDSSIGLIIDAFEQIVADVKGLIQKVPPEILPDSVVEWAHGTSARAVAGATTSAQAEGAAQFGAGKQFELLAGQAKEFGFTGAPANVNQTNRVDNLNVTLTGAPDMSPGDLQKTFSAGTIDALDGADFGLADFQNLAEGSP